MKYFVVNGLLPTATERLWTSSSGEQSRRSRIYTYRRRGIEPPREGERVFLRVRDVGTISVFVFNIDQALVLISARSQRKAYCLALPVKAFFGAYEGLQIENRLFEYLIELTRKPETADTIEKIADLYRKFDDSTIDKLSLSQELRSGPVVPHGQLSECCRLVKAALEKPRFLDALAHIERSHVIFPGQMTGGYYHFHYRHDRMHESAYVREKKYLESKTRYDLAFLSAFRAIEAVLNNSNFRKNEIPRLFAHLDRETGRAFSVNRWRSWHQVFSSRRKWWSYPEIVAYFLRLRNAVAAHGTLKRPFILAEDQVLEIQRFTEVLIWDCLIRPDKPDV